MATAWGYGDEIYLVFLASLRAVFSGDVVILAPPNRTSESALALCATYRARVVADFDASDLPYATRFVRFDELCAGGAYHRCLGMDFRDALYRRRDSRTHDLLRLCALKDHIARVPWVCDAASRQTRLSRRAPACRRLATVRRTYFCRWSGATSTTTHGTCGACARARTIRRRCSTLTCTMLP